MTARIPFIPAKPRGHRPRLQSQGDRHLQYCITHELESLGSVVDKFEMADIVESDELCVISTEMRRTDISLADFVRHIRVLRAVEEFLRNPERKAFNG